MLNDKNWHEITESQFEHEKEGLASLRQACSPDSVLNAFTNFEFLDDQGKLYEVDALLLTVYGLALVELKHYRGQVAVDELTWIRRTSPASAPFSERSPLSGTNHKCKVLGQLVRRHIPTHYQQPRLSVEPLIYLSHGDVKLEFSQPSRFQPICTTQNLELAVNGPLGIQRDALPRPFLAQVQAALEKLGIRQGRKRELRVGEYLVKNLLGEGPNYQDHLAVHTSLGTEMVRVRTFVGKDLVERQRAQRTANREFMLLRHLRHDHILSPEGYKEWELGPALIYPFYKNAKPLDVVVGAPTGGQQLGFGDCLRLWGQIGEALRYAHQRHIYHRSLAPQNVLLLWPEEQSGIDAGQPDAKVINWQTVSAEERTTGTVHLSEWVEERATAYLAPEMLTSPNEVDHSVDLFSLGCLGYFLFTGQDPARNQSELQEKLYQQEGLNLLGVLDQAPEKLVQLVRDLTHPVHYFRPESANVFLQRLAEVERDWRSHKEVVDECLDPLLAQPGDLVLPGYQLVRKLGQGSSSVAFLVSNGEELVLKVPLRSEHNERLLQEAEVLQKISHRKIVQFHSLVQVGSKKGLLLTSAGPETLAERLARDGVLGLELLHRFGDDLLETVEHLEKVGMVHRDIKPANLGVGPLSKKSDLHLVLFDFSLAREERRKVEAGTPGYRDPFLHSTQRPWDEAAERYAAAVTLYEMATGRLPQWGDGRAVNPAVADVEVQFFAGDFEPTLRDRFESFFRKAFQRKVVDRHESAGSMRSEWRELFVGARLDESPSAVEVPDQVAADTPLTNLTGNPQLLQVFDRLRLSTASALMGVPRSTLLRLSNAGGATRTQLRDLYDLLKERLVGTPQPYQGSPEQALESLLETLLPKNAGEAQLVRAYLCGTAQQEWPLPGEAARSVQSKLDPNKVTPRARQQWAKHAELEALAGDIDQALQEMGQAATVDELCDILLSLRGSLCNQREERRRLARGVLRAILEREGMQSLPRFDLVRSGRQPLVCCDLELAEKLVQAAQKADELVTQEPLPSLTRSLQELSQIVRYEQTPPEGRLQRLVVSLARRARLSSRGEFYPSEMAPSQSLRLMGGLLAGRELKHQQLQELVHARYPEAAPLPQSIEAVDKLFEELNLAMRWDDAKLCFRSTLPTSQTGRSRSSVGTVSGTAMAESEARLREALRGGEPQVIKVRASELALAEDWLRQTFELPTVSLEDRLVEEMIAIAKADNIEEAVLWEADELGPSSPEDWSQLKGLAREAALKVLENLRDSVVIKRFSLWGRYGLLPEVQGLIDRAGTPDGPGAVWLLAPFSDGMPTIDNQPLPMPPATRPVEWNASGWLR